MISGGQKWGISLRPCVKPGLFDRTGVQRPRLHQSGPRTAIPARGGCHLLTGIVKGYLAETNTAGIRKIEEVK